MSVRLRKWKNAEGEVLERWMIDVKVKLPGSSQVVRVRDFSPVNTRRGAEQHERQVRQQILDGTFGKETKTPLLEEFYERFKEWSGNHNKRSTVYAKESIWENHLGPALGKLRLDAIRLPEVEAYKSRKLEEGLKPKSINNHLAVLGKLLNLAVDYGLIEHAPKMKKLRLPPQDFDFLTFEEADRLLDAATPQWKAMLTTAIETGLRLGELLALKWEDIDFKAGRLMVRRTLWQGQEDTPKGGKAREVALSGLCSVTLKGHRHLAGPYVFCAPDGSRLTHSMVKDVVPNACHRAGLAKRLTWHDLRHTFASHLVMLGEGLKAVQELLGHATLDMTLRYAHLSPDVKRDAVKRLDSRRRDTRDARGAQEGHTEVEK